MVICEKYYKSFTSWLALFYKLACPPDLVLKKAKKFSFQFPITLAFNIFAIQPNFVARDITFRLCILVVISLLKLLCILEVFFIDSYQFSELGC